MKHSAPDPFGNLPAIAWPEIDASVVTVTQYKVPQQTESFCCCHVDQVPPKFPGLLFQRKDILGLDAASIAEAFSLKTVPGYISQIILPGGCELAMGKLTNAAGQRMTVFRILGGQGNVPKLDPEASVRAIFANPSGVIQVVRVESMTGPDGMPYYGLHIAADAERNKHFVTHSDIAQRAIEHGRGIAFFDVDKGNKSLMVYRYHAVLALNVFGDLRPQTSLDPHAYSETINAIVPPGTKVLHGYPSEKIFPAYAQTVLSQRMEAAAGSPLSYRVALIEYPEIDGLIRFRILVDGFKEMSRERQDAIGRAAAWCLPYAIFVGE